MLEVNHQTFSMEKILLFTAIVLLVSWLFHGTFRAWYNRLQSDVKYDIGIPPFGSHWRELFNIESWQDTLKRLYYKYPNDRFVVLDGFGGQSEYLIRDPNLVKQIAVTDFSSFVDRISGIHPDTDPVLGNALTNRTSNDWRRIRNVLTPLLSGQKLKQIVIPSLEENKRDLVQYLCEKLKEIGKNELIVDMMDLNTRSTVDAFCLTTFGLKTDSLRQNGDNYGFLDTAQSYLANGPLALNTSIYWAIIWFPRTMNFLFGKTLMPKNQQHFFQDSCRNIADIRGDKQFTRPDYIQLLQSLRTKNNIDTSNGISMIAD